MAKVTELIDVDMKSSDYLRLPIFDPKLSV